MPNIRLFFADNLIDRQTDRTKTIHVFLRSINVGAIKTVKLIMSQRSNVLWDTLRHKKELGFVFNNYSP